MNTSPRNSHCSRFTVIAACSLLLAVSLAAASKPAQTTGKTYAKPDDAVAALATAANAHDREALRAIFGPASDELISVDEVQMTNDVKEFTAALNQARRIIHPTESTAILEVGKDRWPFPIPLVKKEGQWFFDTEAGKEEVLNRRVGRNELSTLKCARGYVEAQREYATRDHRGNDVLQYAQKLISSSGKKDGLYWPPELNGEISPLGPLVAEAQAEGYGKPAAGESAKPRPFHGYCYKILTRQGKSAPGGKYDYVINGNMIGGFALVAYPAQYGESGVMTFIVNQRGRVYEKNLGPNTAKVAAAMQEYDPDSTWMISKD
jgi:hypothetical protein